MPSRVIRGEINASRSLSRVSLEADLTFRALLVSVDDFGRCEADPLMLKAELYPRRPAVTPETVAAWVDELAADGCVRLYVVEGIRYLQLTGNERHRSNGRRAAKSKFPDPPPAVTDASADAPAVPRISEQPPGSENADRMALAEIRPSSEKRVASSDYREGAVAPEDGRPLVEALLLTTAARDYPHLPTDQAVCSVVWAEKNTGKPTRIDLQALDDLRTKRIPLAQIVAHLRQYLETVAPQFQSFPKFVSKFAHYAPKPKVVKPEHRRMNPDDFAVMERPS